MNLFKSNYFERAFAGNGLLSIIYYLRKLVNGFDANTLISNGGGIEGVNDRLDVVSEKLDALNISVKLDDPNIASTKTNTDTIKADTTTITSLLTQINSKMKTILVVTQAEYDLIDPKDPNTIYLITQDTQP